MPSRRIPTSRWPNPIAGAAADMPAECQERANTPAPKPPALRLAAFFIMLAVCALISAWLVTHTDAISQDGPDFIEMARHWCASPAEVVHNFNYHVGYPVAIV